MAEFLIDCPGGESMIIKVRSMAITPYSSPAPYHETLAVFNHKQYPTADPVFDDDHYRLISVDDLDAYKKMADDNYKSFWATENGRVRNDAAWIGPVDYQDVTKYVPPIHS